jgi:crotonobetainyl-CoA:carnitine CoA-transferase CaiB-like acyl-CoA transferase
MSTGELEGLRVLDIATLFAAPQIATMLGDRGAEVVKVEPPGGDPLRHMGVQRDGTSVVWELVSRNKRSIELDLDTDAGQAELRQLVEWADVLVENFSPELRKRRHCTYEELSAINQRLIQVSVSCFGLTGPYADRPGNGTIAEAFAGLTHMIGEPDGPPILPSVAIGDTLTAFSGVIGVLAACWSRDTKGGKGRLVDVSMYEPILQIMATTIGTWDGTSEPPKRTGSRVPGGVPRNVYKTNDGKFVAISGTTDPQVARVLAVIGHDTPESRARYGKAADRLQVGDQLDTLVADWVAANDRDAVMTAFLDARVPIAPVNDARDIAADPHIKSRLRPES